MPDKSLEKLKKQLYSRSEKLKERQKKDALAELHAYGRKERYGAGWQKPESRRVSKKMPVTTKLIIALGIFATTAVAASIIYLFGGFGSVSSRQISIDISGPVFIDGGQKASWRVIIQNTNTSSLEHAEIAFEYPRQFNPVSGKAKTQYADFSVERRNLGIIKPGEYVEEIFEAFVFGEEDSVHEVMAILEYRIEGSGAILEKIASSEIKILKSPIGVSVNMPETINEGQEVEIEIAYSSNAPEAIAGVNIKMEYPDGFEFVSSDPTPSFSENEWQIGALRAKEEGRIVVRGKLGGENLENKVFRAVAESRPEGATPAIYGAGTGSTVVRRPFLNVALKINGQSDYVASPNEILAVSVLWKNNLPSAIKNAVLELNIEGAALDYSTASADQGFYRGTDKSAVWNSSSYPAFSYLQPGQEGELKFKIRTLKEMPVKNYTDRNFVITLAARFYSGERPAGFEGVDIEGKISKEFKVSSNLQLSRQGYYYSSTLPNSGPLPPKIGNETTYTVVWSLANSSNDVKDIKVSATLPSYIKWKGVVFPAGESVSYNEATGLTEWKISELASGTGILTPAREVAFQIGIIPSEDQAGISPMLISEVTAEATDIFTGQVLRDEKSALTTRLYTDPQIKYGEYEIVR